MCDENVNFSTLETRVLNYAITALVVISFLIIADFYQRFFSAIKISLTFCNKLVCSGSSTTQDESTRLQKTYFSNDFIAFRNKTNSYGSSNESTLFWFSFLCKY